MRRVAVVVFAALAACGSSSSGSGGSTDRWRPAVEDTWQWQLQGELNTGYDVDVYDVDVLDTSAETIADLHGDGRRVVCYFSAGTWESFRDDADAYPDDVMGAPVEGFADERWLDVRDDAVRAVATDRLDLAREKRCDGVEPDNVDGWDHDTGFDLAASDQLDFNRFLADAVHERGLAVGLKNDLAQVPELVDDFDFAVVEQCHELGECDALAPFVERGKPVFDAEYATELVANPDATCADALARDLRTLLLPMDLDDSFRISCDEG